MRRKCINPEQKEILLHRMEIDHDLFKPRLNSFEGRRDYKMKWQALMQELHEVKHGPTKTVPEWQRVWAHMKNKIKLKANTAAKLPDYPPRKPLSEFDERVMNLIGEDIPAPEEDGWDPLNVSQINIDPEEDLMFIKAEDGTVDMFEMIPVQTRAFTSHGESSLGSTDDEKEPPKKKVKKARGLKGAINRLTSTQNEQLEVLQGIKSTLETNEQQLGRIAYALEVIANNCNNKR